MSYSHDAILTAQHERIAQDQAIAVAQLEAARMSEDPDATNAAAQRILELDAQQQALAARAQQFARAQQSQPQGSQYGLSPEEVEIARISGLTEEQYLQNRRRMEAMKGQGYWSQGSVKR